MDPFIKDCLYYLIKIIILNYDNIDVDDICE